jgi:hypothetical protein
MSHVELAVGEASVTVTVDAVCILGRAWAGFTGIGYLLGSGGWEDVMEAHGRIRSVYIDSMNHRITCNAESVLWFQKNLQNGILLYQNPDAVIVSMSSC